MTIKVLYVDDEPALLDIGKIFLERGGDFTVDTLGSAKEALAKINEEDYDAIISDYQMPGMDGIEFLRAIRTSGRNTPFIIFTGKGREEVVIQAFDEGADFYLQKGGDPRSQFAELDHKIRHAVDLHNRRLEVMRAQYELHESNKFLESLISSASAPIVVWDRERRVTRFNHAFEALTGIPADEAMGMDISELFPDPVEEFFLNEGRTKEHGTEGMELPITHRNGEIRTVIWNVANIRDDITGEVIAMVAQGQDITDRKKFLEALEESENQLKSAIEGSGVGLWDWRVETGELMVNDRWFEIIDYDLEDLEPISIETWNALLHPDDKITFDALLARYFHGELPIFEYELRLKAKDGSYKWILTRGKVMEWDDEGHPIRMIGTNLDINDLKVTEEGLREAEAYTKSVLDNLPIGVAVNTLGPGVSFSYMNDMFPFTYRTTRDALEDTESFWEAVYEDENMRALMREKVLEDCQSGDKERMHWEDVPITRKGKETRYITARNLPVPGKDYLVSTVWDVTDRKKAEDSLKLANSKMSMLVSITRHDLKNKLSQVMGFLQLAIDSDDVGEESRRLLARAEKQAESIERIIDFTKDYQKLGMEAAYWQDLAILIDNAVSIVNIEGKHFKKTIPRGTRIYADPLVIKVFINLMDNAVRYGGENVSVTTSIGDDGLSIIFEDDGEGVRESEKDEIFEHGYGKNTGLGLFLVREILSLTGMTIKEEGVEGEGARFIINVPAGGYRSVEE